MNLFHMGRHYTPKENLLNEQLETTLLLPVLAIIIVFLSIFIVVVFKRNPVIVLTTVVCCTMFLFCYLISHIAPTLTHHYM
ncbi:hypothetical protein WA026_020535 [Henosepilachna vigintioctopunctata]|uniref:NADH dehydrogenase subunit 6 n=1 Tax=Henosepilachna vigintioctopunctata TaxID=420089 RepID=A0AAW1VHC7_9CUCU